MPVQATACRQHWVLEVCLPKTEEVRPKEIVSEGLRADETKGGRSCSDVASDARKRRSGQLVGLLPWDCPYCYEMLHELSRGWGVAGAALPSGTDHVSRAQIT